MVAGHSSLYLDTQVAISAITTFEGFRVMIQQRQWWIPKSVWDIVRVLCIPSLFYWSVCPTKEFIQ